MNKKFFTGKFLLIIIILLVIFLAACGETKPTPTTAVQEQPATKATISPTEMPGPATAAPAAPVPQSEVSFTKDVLPIFEKSCTSCHGQTKQSGGLALNNYAAVQEGKVIKPGDASGSELVTIVASGRMPKRGDKLTQTEIDTIKAWIEAGAPDN